VPTWDSSQYLQFADERTRPCRELAARIALPAPRRIVDLGCGPGNSTAGLAQRWPEAEIEGVDNSPNMIAAAQKDYPAQKWTAADIATWAAPAPCDLVFSNAALQWVGDHAAVFPRLARQVASGGALAVQVPANIEAPAHRLMRDLAQSAAWRDHFSRLPREWFVQEPAFYYDALASQMARLDLWTTEYFHVMENAQAIVEWYRGSGLRPFLDVLPAGDQPRFLADYGTLIAAEFPARSDGRVLFPFLRLFIIAYAR
jgi:trans-aconitate 2-methyltransferase